MYIHSVIERSEVNGPGSRYTIWFQGCSIHCKDCANKELWEPCKGEQITPEQLLSRVQAVKNLDGISITGGEPLDQYSELVKFLELASPLYEVFLTSGYTLDVIKEKYPKVLEHIDILIDGPFILEQIDKSTQWHGSSNQGINLLTDRAQRYKDYKPKYGTELIFSKDGTTMTATGFTMPDFIDKGV